jgi:hypothetical protein
VTSSEDRSKELFDDFFLPDDRFAELDFHLFMMFAEFTE